ncbi:5'-3' exonuclease PLD3-like isoform X2 [Hermetia illucens]|nr:5'-3' exonuclease PLD3-like isoform X2 [Hermetia illucens]
MREREKDLSSSQVYKVNRLWWSLCIGAFVLILLLVPITQIVNNFSIYFSKTGYQLPSYYCKDVCSIYLVETIPIRHDMDYISEHSIYDAWLSLLEAAEKTIDICSFSWSLQGADQNYALSFEDNDLFQALRKFDSNRKGKVNIFVDNFTWQDVTIREISPLENYHVQLMHLPKVKESHTTAWVADRMHFYLGTASVDWRFFRQDKEMGVLLKNCPCLAEELVSIFHAATVQPSTTDIRPELAKLHRIDFDNKYEMDSFFTISGPMKDFIGGISTEDAIVKAIANAKKFIYISVITYYPFKKQLPDVLYLRKIHETLCGAIERRNISIKLLTSWTESTDEEEQFLNSFQRYAQEITGKKFKLKRISFPKWHTKKGSIDHSMFLVTDNTAFIGISDWRADYFFDTPGIGLVLQEVGNKAEQTIRTQLIKLFQRDWNSQYAFAIQL